MAVPYVFANATSAIPLSNLDNNFSTPVTIGNVAIQLGNTATTLSNLSLANVTITSSSISNITGSTANAVVYANTTSSLITGTGLQFDGSNLGLSVTPNAWNSDYKAFNYGGAGLLYGRSGGEVAFGTNWYRNAAGTFLYTTTNFASYYAQSSGVHYLFSAPSGTAGNTVTFTQVLSINKGTTLVLENGTSSSGTGIAFPITQSASSNANTLDDYEEGTWTPGQGSGLTVVGTFSSVGRYTKIGRYVFVSGLLTSSTTVASTAGTQMFTGLPFTILENATTGTFTNGPVNVIGGIGAFGTQAYSSTTVAATSGFDFTLSYSVS
jgi:hypothetical protein